MDNEGISRRGFAQVAVGGVLGGALASAQSPTSALAPPSRREPPTTRIVLQDLIDQAYAKGGGTIELGEGRIVTPPFRLRDSVVITGQGATATELRVLSSGKTPAVSLDRGPVRYAGLRRLGIMPYSGTSEDVGVELEARKPAFSGPLHGGLWWSSFEELHIAGYAKGMTLTAGDNDLLPHQFLSFHRLQITVPRGGVVAMAISGPVNQLRMTDSFLETSGYSPATTLLDLKGCRNSHLAPTLLKFELVTLQGAGLAARIGSSQTVRFETCWFEQLGQSLSVEDAASGIIVDQSRFANAGRQGDPIICAEGTELIVRDSVFAGPESSFSGVGAKRGFQQERNSFIWGATNGDR